MTPMQGSEPWMPNGFPPPSFVVEVERTTSFLGGARGRWLAAAAILGVLLLIAGTLLILSRGDDNKQTLKTGPTTTAFGDSGTSTSSSLDATATLPDAGTTAPGGSGGAANTPTIPGAPGTTTAGGAPAPGPAAAPGVLAATSGAISLATTPPQTGSVGLRNTGASPLTFTTQSDRPGALTASPDTGTIAPGATTTITVALDPNKVPEGPFTGKLGFGGSGGNQTVTVTTTVARPPTVIDNAGENCATESATCSKLVKLENSPRGPAVNLCDTPWRYRVTITDESGLNAVQAVFKGASPPTPVALTKDPATGLWQSGIMGKPSAALTFSIEATDQFGAVGRTSDRVIGPCP